MLVWSARKGTIASRELTNLRSVSIVPELVYYTGQSARGKASLRILYEPGSEQKFTRPRSSRVLMNFLVPVDGVALQLDDGLRGMVDPWKRVCRQQRDRRPGARRGPRTFP